MVRESLLKYSFANGLLVPHFFNEKDHPWLTFLIQEYNRFVGRRRAELTERWKEPLPFSSPSDKKDFAIHVLNQGSKDRLKSVVPPAKARMVTFKNTCGMRIFSPSLKNEVLLESALKLGIAVDDLENSLFADLPEEREVLPLQSDFSAEKLALQCNLLMTQGIVFRASEVKIKAFGGIRPIIRQAKLRGLICNIQGHKREDLSLNISGPLSIFRRTLIYGRHLAEIVPLLAWTNQYEMTAHCVLRGRHALLKLDSKAPLKPSNRPKSFDSNVERRFFDECGRILVDWDIIREPEPLEADGTLIFPDFYLRNRKNPGKNWFVEIIGFWTPDYLAEKLHRLRQANVKNIILCIDQNLNCSTDDCPSQAKVIRYRKRIDPSDLKKIIE